MIIYNFVRRSQTNSMQFSSILLDDSSEPAHSVWEEVWLDATPGKCFYHWLWHVIFILLELCHLRYGTDTTRKEQLLKCFRND